MPKFYFDVFDGQQVLVDNFGDDFYSEKEAANQGLGLLPDLMKDHLPKQDNTHAAVSVRNDSGEVIYRSVSVIRSQWTCREDHCFRVTINREECVLAQARKIRDETRSLSERMRVNAHQIFSIIESAVRNIEISRKLLRGDEY